MFYVVSKVTIFNCQRVRGHPCTLWGTILYCYGNERWCRKGEMEFEVEGRRGEAGLARILGFNCSGLLKYYSKLMVFFGFISQAKPRGSAVQLYIFTDSYFEWISLLSNMACLWLVGYLLGLVRCNPMLIKHALLSVKRVVVTTLLSASDCASAVASPQSYSQQSVVW